jgi:Polyketide cyclase / dehydrase and lipid transport
VPFPQQSSASIEVSAAPEVVWRLVADITRMGEWSPECVRAEWEGDASGPAVGAHFHGFNKAGTFEWDVPGVVTECEPGRLFAFSVPRDATPTNVWRFEFAPSAEGTTLTESFDAPLINVEGSPANFEGRFEMLAKAINKTIANIKTAAEATSG